jgi:hypothetical protein
MNPTWKKLAMTVKAQRDTTTNMAALVRPKRAESNHLNLGLWQDFSK